MYMNRSLNISIPITRMLITYLELKWQFHGQNMAKYFNTSGAQNLFQNSKPSLITCNCISHKEERTLIHDGKLSSTLNGYFISFHSKSLTCQNNVYKIEPYILYQFLGNLDFDKIFLVILETNFIPKCLRMFCNYENCLHSSIQSLKWFFWWSLQIYFLLKSTILSGNSRTYKTSKAIVKVKLQSSTTIPPATGVVSSSKDSSFDHSWS